MSRILILGGGFGGLAAANLLRSSLDSSHEVIVVDKSDSFMMGLAKLDIVVGRRKLEETQAKRELLERKGIKFVKAEVAAIDVAAKVVATTATDNKNLSYDYLIIALGAELAPEKVKGFENSYNLYDYAADVAINQKLRDFSKGKILVLIASTPFKCPGAPYEASFMVDDFFRQKGIRDSVEIAVATPEPQPLPVAGKAVGDKFIQLMKERGIGYFPNKKVAEINAREIKFDDGSSASFDLALMVPPHKVPGALVKSGFAQESGWVPVEASTLKTKHDCVYAIGDCASIMLPVGKPMPKVGVLAEGEAAVVANHIVHEITGSYIPDAPVIFSGQGACYVEVGNGKALFIEARFFEIPPEAVVQGPSESFLLQKAEFEISRVRKWFG